MHVAPLPIMRAASETFKRTVAYGEQSIQRYKRLLASDPTNAPPTLFTKLFRAGDEGLPDKEIRTEAVAYIIAGSDTTANTLTYLLWSVCRDDKIKEALTTELLGLPDDFSDHHLKELPYLNQVIDETLRLYSAAPSGLPRAVPPGGAQLSGYFLPSGATVCTQAYSLHRDPDVFPSPEVFDPSRWKAPTKAMKDLFMPFGGGSRGEPSSAIRFYLYPNPFKGFLANSSSLSWLALGSYGAPTRHGVILSLLAACACLASGGYE